MQVNEYVIYSDICKKSAADDIVADLHANNNTNAFTFREGLFIMHNQLLKVDRDDPCIRNPKARTCLFIFYFFFLKCTTAVNFFFLKVYF